MKQVCVLYVRKSRSSRCFGQLYLRRHPPVNWTHITSQGRNGGGNQSNINEKSVVVEADVEEQQWLRLAVEASRSVGKCSGAGSMVAVEKFGSFPKKLDSNSPPWLHTMIYKLELIIIDTCDVDQ
ncbi:hypothetical protein E3N88_28673 [Mikania micrantha]|uniref:Uncharacterized protein n=1 Tax=Mikania micrantha TaxID=192012 RepID=A0A5N6N330_9ASTR|nr:hypothetical protein E3N88_28673 [Mikania micrantha]